ncbi:MAG: chromosomal replication initiator protein DnaA [Opitutales bacterium]|nr:chromosomal replication initiator protein DnaA [Opitutales bacterium]
MASTDTAMELWDTVRSTLKDSLPGETYEMWFSKIEPTKVEDGYVELLAPNEFSAIWIQDNFMDLVRKEMSDAAGHAMEVSLVSPERVQARSEKSFTRSPSSGSSRLGKAGSGDTSDRGSRSVGARQAINPSNTFEDFVVGPGNQLAQAACVAVANAPAQAYNPLFLYGETGLGKTHLMHAVAHQVFDKFPELKIRYVSCEKFTNEFIRAIQENTLTQFRRNYREVDLLLIDDVQFLAGKERIQEEFFHTFNELFESQRQIVLTSDRPAGEINKLESRLLSRFQWGMVSDIQAPDLETRVAILSNKAATMKVDLAPEILEFLAKSVARNVRRMEGALTRVASYVTLVKKPVDVETVGRLLHDILQEEALSRISIEKIQKKVTEYYHLRMADMVSRRRPNNIAFPRQVAMYLSRVLTDHSLQEIGDAFGGRDHGTVIHACKTVENMMDQDASVKRSVDYLTEQLSHGVE